VRTREFYKETKENKTFSPLFSLVILSMWISLIYDRPLKYLHLRFSVKNVFAYSQACLWTH